MFYNILGFGMIVVVLLEKKTITYEFVFKSMNLFVIYKII